MVYNNVYRALSNTLLVKISDYEKQTFIIER